MDPKTLMKLELRKGGKNALYRLGFAIVAFEAASGYFLARGERLTEPLMGLLLGHLLLGFFLWISCFGLVWRHLQYRKVIMSRAFDVLGFGTAAALLVSASTGSVLVFAGTTGHSVLLRVHVTGSGIAFAGLLGYVATTLGFFFRHVRDKARPPMAKSFAKIALKLGTGAVVIALATLAIGYFRVRPPWAARVSTSLPFGGSKPFFPASVASDRNSYVDPHRLMGSRSCGTTGCHVDIARQWEQSAHHLTPNVFVETVLRELLDDARAGKLFEGMNEKHLALLHASKPGMELFRRCAGCHAPVALLSGQVNPGAAVEGFRRDEGNSCLLCHSISRLNRDPGPFGREIGYHVSDQPTYLFSGATDPVRTFLHEILIKAKPQSHRETFMKPYFKESNYCASCHDQMLFKSWEYSKYGPQSDPWHREKTTECQDCHMPQVEAHEDVSARIKGTVADHRFLAGGLALAKLNGLEDQFIRSEAFLQDRKMKISILAAEKIRAGDPLEFVVRVANIGIGHVFPSGPEGDLMESWPQITIRDETGRTVFQYGALQASGAATGEPGPETRVYRIIPSDRNGMPLDLAEHRSWKFARFKMNVIPPMKYDEVPFRLVLPKGRQGARFTIEAKLEFRKPSQRFADHVFGPGKFTVPVVDMSTDTAVVSQTASPEQAREAHAEWASRLREPPGAGLSPIPSRPQTDLDSDFETRAAYELAEQLYRQKDFDGARNVLDAIGTAPGISAETLQEAVAAGQALTADDIAPPKPGNAPGGPRDARTCFVDVPAEEPAAAKEFLDEITGSWKSLDPSSDSYTKSVFYFSEPKQYIATAYEPGPSNKDFLPYQKVCVSKPLAEDRGRLAGFRLIQTLAAGERTGFAFAAKLEPDASGHPKLLLTDRYYDWWAGVNSLNALPTVVNHRPIRAYVRND